VHEDRTAIVNRHSQHSWNGMYVPREHSSGSGRQVSSENCSANMNPTKRTQRHEHNETTTSSSCRVYSGAFAGSQSDANAMCTLQINLPPTQRSFCNSEPNILPETKSEDLSFFVSQSTADVTGCASRYRLFNKRAVSEEMIKGTLCLSYSLCVTHTARHPWLGAY